MDTQFRIEMLGKFGVWQGNREISRFRTQKTAALLAYLAFYSPRAHAREALFERFWPHSELDAARSNLSVALNALRRQLEPPGIPTGAVLIADRSQVRLDPIAFTTDVEDFEEALREAEAETVPGHRLALWVRAIDLYHGDLLPGYYEDWILAERDRLRDAYRSALRQVTKECAERREYARAIEYAHRTVQTDPLRESSYRDLMRLYVSVGRGSDALYQYEELARLLEKAYQVQPSAATRELAEQIKARGESASPPLSTQHSIPNAQTRTPDTQVENRKSTVESPTPSKQRPTRDVQRPTHRIPLQFTRFYGQEEATARLTELLGGREKEPQEPVSHPTSGVRLPTSPPRLLTLTGPGGTGKTRLSIEVAERVRADYPGGIWFVPLADVYDPLRIGEVIRDILELPRQTQPPALDQAIAFLNGQEGPSLLILDNFEQITAGGASVVWTLLNRAATLRCLVSSRQVLSLPGEREYPIQPLPTPVIEPAAPSSDLHPLHLLTYPSVSLFVDRAQAARPEFQITPRNAEAIAAICSQLEGIPLAIELAAARAKTLTPSQILARLSERFELLSTHRADKGERHRSLWAAIDWSYHLLSPELQRFFARLSVFRGGWSLEAAETVCGEASALNYLSQLQAHSLLQAEESSQAIRFRMLESIREFAAEQLTEEERAETERRHADHFQQWVMGAQLSGPEQQAWYDRFEEDLDNLRAVMDWSLKAGSELEIGLRTVGGLVVFWRVHGHLPEGRRWYARLLEHAGDTPTLGLGTALYGAGTLASMMGDFPAARSLLERALTVALAVGDDNGQAITHNELGSIAYRRGDFDEARQYYQKYLALARAQGHRRREASALTNLASIAQATGDFAVSHTLHTESLEMWREIGDRVGEVRTLHNLANLARSEERWEEARATFAQSVALRREMAEQEGVRDDYGISISLIGLAEVALKQGENAAAAAYARESLALARRQSAHTHLIELLHFLIYLAQADGEAEIAARMVGALERAREEKNFPLPPVDKPENDRILAALQASLGTDVYEAAQSEGRTLSLEQALDCLEERLANRL